MSARYEAGRLFGRPIRADRENDCEGFTVQAQSNGDVLIRVWDPKRKVTFLHYRTPAEARWLAGQLLSAALQAETAPRRPSAAPQAPRTAGDDPQATPATAEPSTAAERKVRSGPNEPNRTNETP